MGDTDIILQGEIVYILVTGRIILSTWNVFLSNTLGGSKFISVYMSSSSDI